MVEGRGARKRGEEGYRHMVVEENGTNLEQEYMRLRCMPQVHHPPATLRISHRAARKRHRDKPDRLTQRSA
jgi:hypothetical protein